MFHFILNTPLEQLTIFAIGENVDVQLGSRYISDMFKERQKLRKTCKPFRNAAAKTRNNF